MNIVLVVLINCVFVRDIYCISLSEVILTQRLLTCKLDVLKLNLFSARHLLRSLEVDDCQIIIVIY